jgi:hypothetical protein
LLGLAHHLVEHPHLLQDARITLALFTGEEVNTQGSRAYVRDREWPYPTAAVNLEIMAQDGPYVYWEADGNVFRLTPTDSNLNQHFAKAVAQVTGAEVLPSGPLTSDGASFLLAGIHATTIGTHDRLMGDAGFHRPTDNINRVVMERLPQAVRILTALINSWLVDSKNADGGDCGLNQPNPSFHHR